MDPVFADTFDVDDTLKVKLKVFPWRCAPLNKPWTVSIGVAACGIVGTKGMDALLVGGGAVLNGIHVVGGASNAGGLEIVALHVGGGSDLCSG